MEKRKNVFTKFIYGKMETKIFKYLITYGLPNAI